MNDILKIFLSLSLSGSLMILILFLCKHFWKDKISRQWQYYIWLIVLARFLFPFAPETNLMGSIFQMDSILQQKRQNSLQDMENTPIPNMEQERKGESNLPIQPSNSQPIQDITTLLANNIWLVWLVVALVLLIRKITVYQSFVRYVKTGQILISDIELLDRFSVLAEQAGVKKSVELCSHPLISSPLLIGFFCPYIVLPGTDISEKDFQYTVLHELKHYQRRDMFYKWLVQLTVCLHWFNPLVYVMSREINKACEFSCDEAVIAKLDFCKVQEYGKTLLDAMMKTGNYKESLASVTLNENKKMLKERLGAIMSFKKKSRITVAITFILTLTLICGASYTGAYIDENISAKNTNEKLEIEKVSAKDIIAVTDSSDTSKPVGTERPYTYSQSGFFQGAYIFELGWNLNERGYNAYPNKAKLTLSDLSTITLSFDKSLQNEAKDQAVLADLKDLIERLKTNSTIPLEYPLVVSIEYIGDNELVNLAEEYYINDELTRFSAIFSSLDHDIQKKYCNKMIEDSKLSFFSSCAKHMDANMIEYYTQKAYQKEKLVFFSSIAPYLTRRQKQKWIVKASKDNKNTFLAVLTRK